jgi:hypothetical protein
VIYLRHAFEASHLPAPSRVAVAVAGDEWLVAQVTAEMQALFPTAQVEVDPFPASSDLLVVVHAPDVRPDDALARVGPHAARLGVALYCVEDRRFDVVPARDLDRWTREQRRHRRVLALSRRVPLVWNRIVRRLVAP